MHSLVTALRASVMSSRPWSSQSKDSAPPQDHLQRPIESKPQLLTIGTHSISPE